MTKAKTGSQESPEFQARRADSELRWLEIAAGIASLIAICGLVALLSQNAGAADASTRPGFNAGNKTFTNPFANAAKPAQPTQDRNNFFDDDDDDDQSGGNAAAPGGVNGATNILSNDSNGGGIPGGGTPPGGVITHNQIPSIHLDSETGEGSKEVVTDFNFPDADIMDIAKTLGKLTGKNFILDKDVKGRITIIANSPITVGDAWRAFLTALDINGFAIIPSGKFLRIARQRDARDKQLKTYTGDYSPDTDALITRVFPLKYINAEEVARTFRSFMPANSRIIGYEQTNTVIVTDTGSNIAKLSKMLEILDIEGYDAGIEVIPVKFASAADLAKLIDQLLPGTGNSPTGGVGAPRFGATTSKFTARRTKEGGIINTIISDDRTNTLIVHANTKGADQVRELVAKLDQKLTINRGGGKVHVVYLQYADAEQIATTLNNLSSGAGAGAFHPVTPGGAGSGTGVNPVAATLFEGAIKVSPDKSTNALVVTASPADFEVVARVIARLDIPRDEVFVEIVIMEVALGNTFNYSANLINPASGIALTPNTDLYSFIANPAALSGAILGFKAGGTQNITIGSTSVQVSNLQGLLNILQQNTKSNILATPQIIALDNTEAFFESSEKIPEPTTTSVQGAGVSQGFTNITVPLSIKLTPQINKAANFVKLKIEAKLSTLLPSSNVPPAIAAQAFASLDRTANTTAVVADGDTVVLGGLTRDEIDDQVNKIPVLGDIPLLGWFFKSKHSNVQKTNLLIFLTPHIVRQYDTVRAILDDKLKHRDEFIEKNSGGDDPLRGARDDMIRSLPDLKELLSRKPQTSITIDEEKDTGTRDESKPFSGSGQPGAGPGQPATPSNPQDPGASFVPPPAGPAAPDSGNVPGNPAPPEAVPPPQPQG